uniref:Uncharacterized protein n=1 Tax=Methylophaga nitratireducenticrescens TaxID=754476 RepID=I1XN86_METNJ
MCALSGDLVESLGAVPQPESMANIGKNTMQNRQCDELKNL